MKPGRVPMAGQLYERVLCSGVALILLACPVDQLLAATDVVVIKADSIYVGDGRVVEHGVLIIENGRVKQVGSGLAVPEGGKVIDIGHGSVTPGLIDANARVESTDLIPWGQESTAPGAPAPRADMWADTRAGEPGPETAVETNPDREADRAAAGKLPLHVGESPEEYATNAFAVGVGVDSVVSEQSSEVVPHTNVLDGLNLDSSDFQRLVRGGVTTVYVSPDASAVIGPRGAVVRTVGPANSRVLVPAAAVKATVGSDPSYFGTRNRSPSRYSMSPYTRRPNSRMGLVWVFRKAFYDALRLQQGEVAYGADTASPEALAVIGKILHGKVPLRIQARIQRDILSALRLADEFKLHFTLEEATEAYLCIDEIKAAKVPVIFGPIYAIPTGIRQRSGEGQRSRYCTLRALLDAGIPTALSAQENREEDGLARQAMLAQRFGVTLDDALRSVTQTPARMLGLDDQIGTLEPGKRGDAVVWSGPPFAATSRIVSVLVDGELIVDRR